MCRTNINLYKSNYAASHLGLCCVNMFLFCMHSACSTSAYFEFRLATPLLLEGFFPIYTPFIIICSFTLRLIRVSKGAKIRSRYNQVPHLTQDTNGKVTNSQLDTTNESQEVNPFPAGDRKAHINRHAQRHSKHKTEQKHKRSTKEVPPWNGQ